MTLSAPLARLGVVALVLIVWEIAAREFGNPLFISPPSETFVAMIGLLGDPSVDRALGTAMWELLVAFCLSVGLGVAIGVPLGLGTFWRGAFFPIVLWLYAIPQVTVLPLFVKVFGIGPPCKIAFGVTHGVFAVIITVVAAARNIDPIYLRTAASLGASRRQVVLDVVFPCLLPSLFTGMRLAMAGVLLGVLLAELYISTTGIGYFSQEFANAFAPAKLFGLIILLAAIAVAFNESLRLLEERFRR
jgi:ABC-type nitrate/sulfonate/bicarbonate transport system permease component